MNDTKYSDLQTHDLNAYQRISWETDQNDQRGLDGLAFPLLGLFGEVGTLLSALKKKQRDKESFVSYNDAVVEGFGDVLWYFSNIASRASLDLSLIAQRTIRDFQNWDFVETNSSKTFEDIQRGKNSKGAAISREFEIALIALAGKVGLLLNDFHIGRVKDNRDVLSAHLVDILRVLIEAANAADIDLATATNYNIRKIHSRWPRQKTHTRLFDNEFDQLEQLPRRIEMHIFEKRRGDENYVIQQCNGINIGSALTDNKMRDDDYRFHDVFHLAYAAVLGWSPVVRALLKVKRKSIPKVDEAQDGSRAIIIEESLSTLIFHRALDLDYFASIKALDYSLLKLISEFVKGYEVEQCQLWEWEKAILEGYKVFRQMRHHRRGVVIADLNERSISFHTLL